MLNNEQVVIQAGKARHVQFTSQELYTTSSILPLYNALFKNASEILYMLKSV